MITDFTLYGRHGKYFEGKTTAGHFAVGPYANREVIVYTSDGGQVYLSYEDIVEMAKWFDSTEAAYAAGLPEVS